MFTHRLQTQYGFMIYFSTFVAIKEQIQFADLVFAFSILFDNQNQNSLFRPNLEIQTTFLL